MPVPKFRTSASKRNMRRSHHFLKGPALGLCPKCGDVKQPHVVCLSCGFYRGEKQLDVKSTASDWNQQDSTSSKSPE